ncbi:MAG TPA: hypothetical protein VFZ53_29745 [Polyangiaceae bacterium]
MVGRTTLSHSALLTAAAAFLASPARAEDPAPPKDSAHSLPGSPRPIGPSLSPEAPPTPPAPGGRAPSFGSPTDSDAWVFRLGGRISAWGRFGVGRQSSDAAPGDDGPPLHTPPIIAGPDPIYAGTAATLNFSYGNQTVMAFASYEASLASPEWEGYQNTVNGARFRSAYVSVTPAPIGAMRLRFQVGAFPAHYGAPGPWGWGMFGPLIAVKGYGGIAALDYDLPGGKVLSLEYGIAASPLVSEEFVRGTYTEWPEVGLSSIVNHAHAGMSFSNKYFTKLHFAHADGRNLRTEGFEYDNRTGQRVVQPDGRMLAAALELRWVEDPFGQFGVTPAYWNFKDARAVHDGIWWATGWTAGGRDMTNKHLSNDKRRSTGQFMAVSAEYDFSLSRILKYPEPFDGNGPDLRVALGFLPFWTLETDDPNYEGADGFHVGASFEHVLLSWLSTTYRFFGESRDAALPQIDAVPGVRDDYDHGRWSAYNVSLGLAFHSDWQSRDRIELAYSRYFYSELADNNPIQPLDKEVFTLGASLAF